MCRKSLCGLLATLLAVASIAGCGQSDGRFGLSGVVRLDGAPIDRGSINFDPASVPARTSTGAMIIDGRYAVAAAQGLLPGTYRVRVFWPQSTGAKPDGLGPLGGVSAPSPQERIPDRYNSKSELTVEVQAHSANRFDFDLSTEAR